MSDTISNALGRAQTLTFTIFSAALIVWLIALTNLNQDSNALARLTAEFDAVDKVASHSDNVIREIRKYLLANTPDDLPERQALRKVQHAFSKSVPQSIEVSRLLVKTGGRDLRPVTRSINRELEDLRSVNGAIVSVNVDLSPQSIALLDQLEALRLRDLIVLAHLVSVDPIALQEVLTRFQTETAETAGPEEFGRQAAALHAALRNANLISRNAGYHQAGHYATALRQASEAFARNYSHLAPGGLQSNYTAMRMRLTDLHAKRGSISDRLSGQFQIAVPIINQSLPVSLLTLLFPLALIGGYGLVATSLFFAKRKILAIAFKPSRRSFADNGFLFDQLSVGKSHTRFVTWALLITMTLLPWIAAVWLVIRFGDGQNAFLQMLNLLQVGLGFLIVLSIFDTSREISQEVSW